MQQQQRIKGFSIAYSSPKRMESLITIELILCRSILWTRIKKILSSDVNFAAFVFFSIFMDAQKHTTVDMHSQTHEHDS